MEHVSESLSAYLDGALNDNQRRDVDAHIAACKACRDELDELKAVSKMVSGLKQVPLPAGFMSRLKNRQARETVSTSDAAQPSWREAFSLRTAAVAVCGMLVSLVAYQHFHYRDWELGQVGSPIGMISGAASNAGSGGGTAADRLVSSSPMNQLKTAAPSVPPPMLANANRPPAAAPTGGAVTNESLQGFLEEDKRRMGIRKVLIKGQAADEGQPEGALSKKEYAAEMAQARTNLRAMSSEINRIMDAKARAPVALEKDKPQLLNQTAGMRQAPAAKAPGEPISLAEPGPRAAMDAAAKNEAAPVSAIGGSRAMAHTAQRGRLTSTRRDMTDSKKTAIDLQSGFVARSNKELKDAWNSLPTEQAAPQVNFDESVFILISAGGGPNAGVKITRIEPAKDKVIVHYRQIPANSGGLVYDYRVAPSSDLPFVFQND